MKRYYRSSQVRPTLDLATLKILAALTGAAVMDG